jgi:hypothetical protein
VIRGAETPEDIAWCRWILSKAHVDPTPTAHLLMWIGASGPTWVVAYDDWLGATCMLYMASTVAYPPKAFRWAVFNYAFNVLKLKIVLGMVKGNNSRALRLDHFLGFKEVYRAEGCAEDGADVILLELKATDWREKNG